MGRRPRKHLTGQEKMFVEAYVRTGDAPYAATKAGYASPDKNGTHVLRREPVVNEIRRQQQTRLVREGLPKALDVMFEVMADKTVTAKTRSDTAYKVATLALGNRHMDGSDKPLEDMTLDEVQAQMAKQQALIDALRAAASTIEGKAVEIEPEDGDVFG